MVAVIRAGKSIHRILNYNENKVTQGKAVCIAAGNFPVDAPQLSLTMKLNRFQKQMDLNRNVKTNSVHISLNFDSSEKNMPAEKLLAIADRYMEKIGFGRQPYLVYQHHDAGHPHIHLLTTNIEADGNRIDLHHLGIRKSEPARKEIETAFGLVKAQDRKQQPLGLGQGVAKKAAYGMSETRAAIQNVLEAVLNKYRFTSLSEFNAVLGLYNIRADQGSEKSRVRRHGGLLYRILDGNGNPVGVPVKASLFYNRPTLAKLSGKFTANGILGQQHKARIKNAVDRVSPAAGKTGMEELEKILANDGISMVKRENSEGFLFGITFIDHKTGGVFNGSALGKQYSAKQMQERFPVVIPTGSEGSLKGHALQSDTALSALESMALANPSSASLLHDIMNIARQLTAPQQSMDFVPSQLKKKRKKRRRGPSNNQ
ncbi:relaxase/mobilization nuclease domain-containing protein [uncultured Flavobacterium sp.]|uniref:relaxase/mobilization nuclease domain-containing protein n=1 Tax=uncultured Flavobacterium sp. TaxID=165435 RepID=UPI0025F52190|nr:relaxase/mobilization nuclease domain-containing protein [uncultured Flavobacterium sp.]